MNDISIIIPTLNRAFLLDEVLPTYLCQDAVRELIIVDDGSTDSTEEAVGRWTKKDARVLYKKHAARKGSPAARNTGIAAATGSYVFNGEDDVVLNQDIFSVLRACMARENADIVGCRTMYMLPGEVKEETLRRYDSLAGPFFDMPSFTFNLGCRSPGPVRLPFFQTPALIKKHILGHIAFDEKYWGSGYREETDFFIRCSKAGYRLIYCPDAPAFNLPRAEQNPGGQFATPACIYELSAIMNNRRFLRKHYGYLHDDWGLRVPCSRLQRQFTLARLKILYDKLRYGLWA